MRDAKATADDTAADNPGLNETLRQLRDGLHASAQGTLDSGQALGELLLADLALARAAGLRALLCAGAALVLAGSAWLLLMATLVATLHTTGLGWGSALLLSALLTLAASALAGWLAAAACCGCCRRWLRCCRRSSCARPPRTMATPGLLRLARPPMPATAPKPPRRPKPPTRPRWMPT